MTNTQSLASIDRQIIQAMRLQSKGCEGTQELIDRLFDARNKAVTDAATGEEMVVINSTIPGATDYTLPLMEAAKRVMGHKRMLARIRKARIETVAA